MTQPPNLTVADIGEKALLERLHRFCPKDIVGDDAAVVTFPSHHSLVITSDVLVDGIHFSDGITTSAEDVGWRAIAANLSDLAAMGATPLGITIGLSLPGTVSINWVERLYQGLSDCLQQYETLLWGGDVTSSSVITVSITAVGKVQPQRVIRRQDAQVGDVILVTAEHGLSRGGLELLFHPHRQQKLTATTRNQLIQAHQRPQPRLDVVPLLDQIPSPFRIAGMDSSDGLADAVIQICQTSGVGAKIHYPDLTLAKELVPWVGSQQALEWCLYGGEDFELVLTLPWQQAKQLQRSLNGSAMIIGEIIPGSDITLQGSDMTLDLTQGFQHWQSR